MAYLAEVNGSEQDNKEFESLLNAGFDAAKPGELVHGTVQRVLGDYVVVDIGYKSEGYIPAQQFADKTGKIAVEVGDQVEVLMLAPENDAGEIVLSRDRAMQLKTWLHLEEVFQKGETVKGEVVQKVKGGLHVDVGVPAFLPGSQVDIRPQRNLGRYIGEEMEFRVLKINKDRGNIVLSRRIVLEEERAALKRDTISHLSEGVVLEGIIKNITDYGAFVDLGGIDGLLHITDISWGRVNHPREALSVGKPVTVVVLKYDKEHERVSLGMKQLHDNPWEKAHEMFTVGQIVKGDVVSLTEYGAFIKLGEGIEGLIHVSEMSWSKKLRKPNKMLNIGDMVEAQVLEISPENQRISLGLKQLQKNPWEELSTEYPRGTRVTGTVRSIMEFGIFVNIKDEIDGLVHLTDLSWNKKIRSAKDIQDLFQKGQEVEAVVLEVDIENERLSLGVKQLQADPWDTIPQRYPSGARVKGKIMSVTEFGVFMELEEGVEGLIHISQLGISRSDDIKSKFEVGSELEAEVLNVDREERRISLSIRGAKGTSSKERDDYQNYMDDNSGSATFGDLLQASLDKE